MSHSEKIKKIAKLVKKHYSTGVGKPIRFTHGSTNSTRVQDKSPYYLIDISTLNQILTIDTRHNQAIVEPNVPMDRLVAACLAKGVIPKVVMEFPGITCGGGINGAALEASSVTYGQFNDICTEFEVVLGDGEIVTASRTKNTDLFYGITGSYGTLALLTKITLELIPAKPYVQLSIHPVETAHVINKLTKDFREYDYLEGIVFTKKDSLIIIGKLSNGKEKLPVKTFSKASDDWFYHYAEKQINKNSVTQILVPLNEYLFRYDRGAFWMGKHAFAAYHMPFNKITRFLLNPFMNTRTMYQGLHATNLAQDFFIQDYYLPLSKAQKFLTLCIQQLGIFPIWLCPIKATNKPQKMSPHYLAERLLIDIGLWGKPRGSKNIVQVNKTFERYLTEYGGRKMFYADSFYSENEFWKLYDKKWYQRMRKKYKAEAVFPNIWEKIYTKKRYGIQKRKIIGTMLKTVLENK